MVVKRWKKKRKNYPNSGRVFLEPPPPPPPSVQYYENPFSGSQNVTYEQTDRHGEANVAFFCNLFWYEHVKNSPTYHKKKGTISCHSYIYLTVLCRCTVFLGMSSEHITMFLSKTLKF